MSPDLARQLVKVVPIEKGGSGRKFWRMRVADRTLIFVRYGEDRPENRHYVAIGSFLSSVGVRVPIVYFHDEVEGLIVMEDAGDLDLWSHRKDSWLERRALYQRTLDQALLLHTRAHLAPGADQLHLQQQFDSALYRWEQEYFLEHCVGVHFGYRDTVDRNRLNEIADELASLPRCLVHRDFQSQNIIIRAGEVCLIDFQGLRPGVAQYDLASLLLDPYVSLTAAEHDELLEHYVSGLLGPEHDNDPEFRRIYDLCAMQRLMQALGAYGKLGHLDRRTEFLEHIPTAMSRLREVVARIPDTDLLRAVLEGLE
ncbi:MAG TPA: phosphotransferase [Chthoniobacteraceae bacterium]|nr:phosphotransferase [Chthoniobacteraceae bacterium]